jgi:esterase/lipase superfamily enzyme
LNAIHKLIDAGRLKCYLIPSIHRETWLDEKTERRVCGEKQKDYNTFIVEELVPFIRKDCESNTIRIAATGVGIGAFQACNQVFRRPDIFDILIALSGFYDLKPHLGGYMDDHCYFNSPHDFVNNLNDDFYLTILQHQCSLNLISGQGSDENPEAAKRFSQLLHKKEIPHHLDLWGRDVTHTWVWWQKMLSNYCELLF